MSYLERHTEEFYEAWHGLRESIKWQLKNQFQNEEPSFYDETAWEVFCLHADEGDLIPNCINKICL